MHKEPQVCNHYRVTCDQTHKTHLGSHTLGSSNQGNRDLSRWGLAEHHAHIPSVADMRCWDKRTGIAHNNHQLEFPSKWSQPDRKMAAVDNCN